MPPVNEDPYRQITDDASNNAEPQSANSAAGWVPRAFAVQAAGINNQQHIQNTTGGLDLNVSDVWLDYTGAGVTVAVYDNGVDGTHPDLSTNYNANLEVANGNNAAPEANDFHGTAVAGVIAGQNDATWGPVGVAYDATIVGVDIWNNSMGTTPGSEGAPFNNATDVSRTTFFRENFDIVNQSIRFGYFENQGTAIATNVYDNIELAAEQGRGGLGTIVVTAAGNDRALNWDTNTQHLMNDRHSITVGGIEYNGSVAQESNPGASLLVSAFYRGVNTTDRVGAVGYTNGDTVAFQGTSAAAPQISGIVALMLEANPNLGWRDVQTILAYTARHVGSNMDAGPANNERYTWHYNSADNWNGGGLHFSNDYGFGLVDAHAAVRLAESWTERSTSANEEMIGGRSFAADSDDIDAIPEGGGVLRRPIIIPQNIDVEKIELSIEINHPRMSDLVIRLISPEGTVSTLLNRPGQGQADVALNTTWTLTSSEFRGEESRGQWILEIEDAADAAGIDSGGVGLVTLRTFGADAADDTYVYTDAFSATLTDDVWQNADFTRAHLSDTDGGLDVINAAAVSSRVRLDLSEGAMNFIGWNGFQIENGTEIEWAIGGDGNDDIFGNDGGNQLRGNRGSDFLAGRGEFDILIGGDGDDVLAGGAAPDQLLGGEGYDFASYYDATTGVSVSLADDSGATGDADGDMFQSIEGLIGSEFRDYLYGDANANDLRGAGGDDNLDGGGGSDVLRGGLGSDSYVVDDASDVVEELADEGAEDSVLTSMTTYELGANVEYLFYSGDPELGFHGVGNGLKNFIMSLNGSDILEGGDGDDTLLAYHMFAGPGGSGRDTLIGGDGDDTMLGGDDLDTYVFADGWDHDSITGFEVGVDVLDFHQVSGLNRALLSIANDENGDAKIIYIDNSITFKGVTSDQLANASFLFDTAHIVGTEGDDVLVADTSANVMEGHGGHDRFHAAYSSNPADIDTMDGGEGTDTADFSASDAAIWVSLAYNGKEVWTQDRTDVASANWREVADLNAIENVVGTRWSDYIAGDNGKNVLAGGTGNDAIYGHGGDDTLSVAYDHNPGLVDLMDGGEGSDTLDLSSLDVAMWIGLDYSGREVWTQDTGNVDGYNWREFADLVSIENVIGTKGSDTIAGNAGNNVLQGGAGNDKMFTHDGSDKVYGDAGDDIITSGAGWSELYGGDDDDTLIGGSVYDLMDGGAGDDTITGTGGQTSMFGGDGDDTMTGSLTSNNAMYGGFGNDTFTGGDWTDWFYDTDGGNETVHAGGGLDVIVDHHGVNFLYGEAGDDWIISATKEGSLLDGGADNDTLTACFGGNTLIGGAGNDKLENVEGGDVVSTFTGGADADTFIYRPGVGVEFNVLVTDFEDGVDHIGLLSWVDFNQLTIEDTAEGAMISYYGTSPMVIAGMSASDITHADFVQV